MALSDIDMWKFVDVDSPYTTTLEISNLEPYSVYTVRVRAKYSDGSFGNLSETAYSNKLEDGSYLTKSWSKERKLHNYFQR